jgi:hypothetical protein
LENYKRRISRLKYFKYLALSGLFIFSFAKAYIEYEQPDPFKYNPKPNNIIVWFIVGAILLRIIE